jgi:hypothetical protein
VKAHGSDICVCIDTVVVGVITCSLFLLLLTTASFVIDKRPCQRLLFFVEASMVAVES